MHSPSTRDSENIEEILERCAAFWREQKAIQKRVDAYEKHPDRAVEAKMRSLFVAGKSHAEVCQLMKATDA